jgi:hypothetical protein
MPELPNKIAGANTGLCAVFSEKSQIVLSLRPGVARLSRWAHAITVAFNMKTQTIQRLILSGMAFLLAGSLIAANAETNHVTGSVQRTDSVIPAGAIKFINLDLTQILPIYASLTDAQLDTNRLVKLPPVLMSFENKKAMTRLEAVQLLDKVFYDHGIAATHVDKKHIVFTYRSSARAK